MKLNVGTEVAALKQMSVGELRDGYAEVFGETTNVRHKDWLVKRVIWRLQALAEGDLSERAHRRAAELANPGAPGPTCAVQVGGSAAEFGQRSTISPFTLPRLP